jgi:hypothetical protein
MDDIHFQYDDRKITIVQLQQLWMLQPDLIFVVNDKVVGSPRDVLNYDNTVTMDGYNYTTTMNSLYNEELTKYKDWLHDTMAIQLSDNGNTLENLLGTVVISIKDKLSKLPQGKYLDVSDPNNTKVLSANKNKFVGTKSRLMSNNYNSFFSALCSIENGASRYADDLRAAKIYFHITSTSQVVCPVVSTKDETIPEKVTRAYTRRVIPKTFMQMLNTIRNNKVIDVSNIDDKGFGAEIILRSNVGDQFVGEKLPLISDNLERFERAISLIRGEEKFKSDLIKARLYFTNEDVTFMDMLGTLGDNQVIDVSNITDEGANAFVISVDEIPEHYFVGKDIPIVSNNYEAFERAILLTDLNYKADIQKAKLFFTKGFLDVSKVTDNDVNVIVIDEEDIGDKYISTVSNMVSDNLPALIKVYSLSNKGMDYFKDDIELAKEYFGFHGQLADKYMNVLNANNKKYLDVSNIQEDGSGIMIINEKDIGDKYVGINVKIVSDNYEAFIKALMLLPAKDFYTYGDDIHFAKQYFGSNSSNSLEMI